MAKSDEEYAPRSLGVAAACAIGMMVSVVPFHIGTFPLFLQPVSETFGWGRATFAASVNISALLAALAAPFVGRAVDRLGARRLLVPAIVLYALATMAQSQLTTSRVQFYATYCCLGLFEAVAGPVAYSQIVSTWFQKQRGLMLALVIGAAPTVSIMVMAPVTHVLIGDHGWRTAYFVLGLIILVLGLPSMALLLRKPEQSPAGRAAQPGSAPGLTVRQVLKKGLFWMILAALVIHSLVIGGVRAHTFALLTDRGMSAGIATLALSVSAFAGLAGNVASGLMLDRIQSPRIALPFFILALIGLIILDHADGAPMALTGVAVLGFGIGAESGIGPYFLSRYFGLKSFGTIYGCLVSLLAISSGLGPFLLGKAYDAYGSYSQGLTIAEVALGVGTVLVALLGPYVYAVHRPVAAAAPDLEAVRGEA